MIASRSAGAFIAKRTDLGRVPEDLFEFIKAELKTGLPAALDDAKEALDANMSAVAEQTFVASITICGIDAAKAWLACHPEVIVKPL